MPDMPQHPGKRQPDSVALGYQYDSELQFGCIGNQRKNSRQRLIQPVCLIELARPVLEENRVKSRRTITIRLVMADQDSGSFEESKIQELKKHSVLNLLNT